LLNEKADEVVVGFTEACDVVTATGFVSLPVVEPKTPAEGEDTVEIIPDDVDASEI
jgi:hypothetical protein